MPTPPIPDNRLVGVVVYGAPGLAVAKRLHAAGYTVHVTGPDTASSFLQALVDEDGAVWHDDVVQLCDALGSEPLVWATGEPGRTTAMAMTLRDAHLRAIVIIDGSTYPQMFDILKGRAASLRGTYGVRCVAASSGERSTIDFNGDTDAIGRAAPVIMAGIRRR